MNILTQNSITLNGYCMKMFKSQTNKLDDDSTLTMISALVKWGRAGELLEMITLWLEAALQEDECDGVYKKPKAISL